MNAESFCPLGVRQEFARDAVEILGWKTPPKFIRRIEEASDSGIYLTNYETIRDGKMDPADFIAISLDEAAVLRGFGGSKTFRELMLKCTGDGGPTGRSRGDDRSVKYRFVATATPSPNEYIELLAYAEFLGIMDISQAKTRFFKRDSTKADKLTLHSHKEEEFWLWVASWALFIQKPSDFGFSDEGYSLPEMEVHWHCVESDYSDLGFDKSGQGKLMRDAAIGVQDASAEKRASMAKRIEKMVELRNMEPAKHCIIWHDLEDERRAIQDALPDSLAVWGSQDMDERERRIIGFSDGDFATLSTKPVIAGSGCNFQRFCAWEIFLGIGFKFQDFIQAIHRTYRFLQTGKVRIDIIYTEAEYAVKRTLERKWKQHNIMVKTMTEIIKKFGLSQAAMASHLTRGIGIENPLVCEGERFMLANEDTVKGSARLEENSVDLIITSIPFSNHYEYTPSYNDFGHTDNDAHFFEQMDFLIPELLRVTKPGRLAAIHTKDRIFYGSRTGDGFSTVNPFHMTTTFEFMKHGWRYMGMAVIHTDVVNENNGNYRLSHGEMKKDGTKMGFGSPEYLLLFRKPQTHKGKAYADEPVKNPDYSLGRWQLTADANWRSSGNRLLDIPALMRFANSEDGLRAIRRRFNDFYKSNIYNFEDHVALNEALGDSNKLPTKYHLLQAPVTGEHKDYIWDDVNRLTTLNTNQSQSRRENHVCPLQFDIVDRCIDRFSNPGELIYDPFGGLGTVPYRAVLKGRRGMSTELNEQYFKDSQFYLRAADAKMNMPTLFDAIFEDEKAETAA